MDIQTRFVSQSAWFSRSIDCQLKKYRLFFFIRKNVCFPRKINLPRIRDFRCLSVKGFDRNGNYYLGLKDIMS
ncbi:MAG: hypothetical protein ABJL43_00005 [Maribacter dokdonensis]|uniref:hypothetical protein n=1 Tax=Maribacter dokdonensis TaxID=320912 RepID=UPI003296E35C